MFPCAASIASPQSHFSTSSSPACALVTGETLTFREVSDDLITTKPKGQSNFQTASFLNLFAAFVTFHHLLLLKMLSDLSSGLLLSGVWFSSSSTICLLQSFFPLSQVEAAKSTTLFFLSSPGRPSRPSHLNGKLFTIFTICSVRLSFAYVSRQYASWLPLVFATCLPRDGDWVSPRWPDFKDPGLKAIFLTSQEVLNFRQAQWVPCTQFSPEG